MDGASLKRPPRGYTEEDPFIDDIKQKSFIAGSSVSEAGVVSARFIGEVEAPSVDTLPLMRFVTVALGLSYE